MEPIGEASAKIYTPAGSGRSLSEVATHVGSWVTERRNVLEDYRAVFGEDPPLVTSVSLTTETNNTEERVTAYYGDILFQPTADSLIGPSLGTGRAQD